jgi:hypothetical protein
MFITTVRPRYYLLSLAVSVGIFLVLYFTVIKPDQSAANKAFQQGQAQIQQGERQVQQSLNQAAQSGATIPAGVTTLTSCIAAAGTDASQLQACAAHFKK